MSVQPVINPNLSSLVLTIPKKVLVLHNDEVNTLVWVIDCLKEFCEHSTEQAVQCAILTHYKGHCDIKSGPIAKLQNIQSTLSEKGLTVTIE